MPIGYSHHRAAEAALDEALVALLHVDAAGSFICFSGEVLGFALSPNRKDGPFRLWAKTDEGTATIRAAEVK
jgi:hypothetical protein